MKQKLLNSLRLRACMLVALLCAGVSAAWGETATWSGTTALPGELTAIGSSPINIMVSATNTYTNPIRVYANTTITIQANTGYVIQSVVYEASSTGNYVTYAQNATVTPKYSGQPTVSGKNVTWSFGNNSEVTTFTFTPSSQTRCNSISVTYKSVGGEEKADPELSFSPESVTITEGESLPAITFNNPHSVSGITFSSSKESLATVDNTGAITLVENAYGTATITAAFPGDATYQAQNATCVITVNDSRAWPTLQWQDEDLLKVTELSTILGAPFTAPTVYYTGDGTMTYSSSKESVATINSNGEITILAAGDTEIKVETSQTDAYHASSAKFTLNVLEVVTGEEFELLTDATTLVAGDRIVITNAGSSVAMSTTQNSNNRGETAVALQDGKIVVPANGSEIQVLTLESAEGGWYLNTGFGYLAAVSSGSNYLRTVETTSNNAKAAITANSSAATIAFQGDYTRNKLKYNSSSHIFSCYESGQGDIKIYRKADARANVTLSFADVPETITKGESATYAATATPSVTGITYASSDEEVLTVNETTGEITAVAVGEATITATFAGNTDYKPATALYTITVVAPQHTAKFFVNGVEQTAAQVEVCEGAAITFPANPEGIFGKTFVGWTDAEINGESDEAPTTLVKAASMGTADVNYFAVFANVSEEEGVVSLTIDGNVPGMPDRYGEKDTFSELIVEGTKLQIMQIYKNSQGELQWRAAGNTNGTGTMYNEDALNNIQSIILNYSEFDQNKNFTVKVGTQANPSTGDQITPTIDGLKYTFDCSSVDYSYFVVTNGEYAGYLNSLVINYLGITATCSGYCTTVEAPEVPAPTFDLPSGTYPAGTVVTITPPADPKMNVAVTYSFVDGSDTWSEAGANNQSKTRTLTKDIAITAKTSYKYDESMPPLYSEEVTNTYTIETIPVTIGSSATGADGAYYSSVYYSDKALKVPADVECLTYKVVDGALTVSKTYSAGDVIPADEAVVIKASASGTVTFPVTLATADKDTESMLLGVDEAETIDEAGYKYYKLTLNAAKEAGTAGFYFDKNVTDGSTINAAAHKCYLRVPVDQTNGAKGFVFGEETDGIGHIEMGQTSNAAIYNLNGQKVNKAQKGIYIVNGKKIVIR